MLLQPAIGKTRLGTSGRSLKQDDSESKTNDIWKPERSQRGFEIRRLHFFGENGEEEITKRHEETQPDSRRGFLSTRSQRQGDSNKTKGERS